MLFDILWMDGSTLRLPGRVLQCVQVPALGRQPVGEAENVEVIGAHGHHGHLGVAEHKHSLYLADSGGPRRRKHMCIRKGSTRPPEEWINQHRVVQRRPYVRSFVNYSRSASEIGKGLLSH